MIFEKSYKIPLPGLGYSNPISFHTSACQENRLQSQPLSGYDKERVMNILNKILLFWKDAPSGKSWALEKLSDMLLNSRNAGGTDGMSLSMSMNY